MNIQSAQLAKKYAVAFLNTTPLSRSDYDLLSSLQPVYQKSKKLLFLLQSITLNNTTREIVLDKMMAVIQLPIALKPLVFLLASHHRLKLLPEIITQLVLEYQTQHNIITCSIESSHSISDKQQAIIKQFLTNKTKKEVICSYNLNPSLIAGIHLKSTTITWEYSAQEQLTSIIRTLDY